MLLEKGVYEIADIADYAKGNPDYIKNVPFRQATLIAKNQQGIKDICTIAMVTKEKYFCNKYRVPKSLIKENCSGLLIGESYGDGEIVDHFLRGWDIEEATDVLEFYDYLEVRPLPCGYYMIEEDYSLTIHSEEDLEKLNNWIVDLGKRKGKTVVATMGFCEALENESSCNGLRVLNTDEMIEQVEHLGNDAEKVVLDNTRILESQIEPLYYNTNDANK